MYVNKYIILALEFLYIRKQSSNSPIYISFLKTGLCWYSTSFMSLHHDLSYAIHENQVNMLLQHKAVVKS